MAFDIQALLAALGMGGDPNAGVSPMPLGPMQGLGGFMTGAGPGGATPASSMGITTGPAQMPTSPGPPQTPPPGGLAGLFGLRPGALGGFGSPGGIGGSGMGGPMSLLNAGANMLTASGPGNAGLGSILGSGLGGFMAGGQADRAQSLQQQQQANLQRIAEQLMKQPSGAQPTASAVTPPPPLPGGVQPAAPPLPGGAPQIPGAPSVGPAAMPAPTPVPGPMGGGAPMARTGGAEPNPFIQMMLRSRMGIRV